MKKKELKRLPLLKATSHMMQMAADDSLQDRRNKGYSCYYNNRGYQNGLYMRCKVAGDYLKAAFFFPEHMKMGSRLPAYELYINKAQDTFITYDRLEDKWLTAKLDMLSWPQYVTYSDKKWVSPGDDKILKKYLEVEHGGYRGILEFQYGVRKRALKRRYKKETDPWDLDMEQTPELPKDWGKWVGKVGIAEHFIFYQYNRKGAKKGYCTYCEKEVPVREPRHNKEGKCLCCRNKVTFKSEGKAGTVMTRRHGMFLLQRCEDGVMIRAFKGYRKYIRGSYDKPEEACWEVRRIICSKTGVPLRSYYWGDYKRMETRWIASESFHYSMSYYCYYNCDFEAPAGKVYGKTMPTLAKNELRCTGLPEYIKTVDVVDPEDYLKTWKSVPQLEQLVKAGLPSLARECINQPGSIKGILHSAAGGLAKMLGIDGQALKRLREHDGNTAYLKWLQYEKKSGVILPDSVISWYCAESISTENLKFVSDKMSMVQICNYIKRQMLENSMNSREVLNTWSDYLSMAERLKIDTSDEIIYRVRKLCQRHDELVERCRRKDLALQAGEILKKYPHIEEIYESVKDTYGYAQEDYTVLVPAQIEDILLEGQNLHHCVGSSDRYWERIERQESYVLFLRRSSDRNKSYYTLEIEPDGTVRQKRTMYDRQEADIEEATKFLKKWQKEVSRRLTDKERDLAEKSRMLRVEEFAQMRKDQVIIHTGALQGQLLVDVLLADLMENKEEAAEVTLQKAA